MNGNPDIVAEIKARAYLPAYDFATAEGRAAFDDWLRSELRGIADESVRAHAADIIREWRQELWGEPRGDLTAAMLADALGCFWNAALGEAHARQEGFAFASIMATGVDAIRQRLDELTKARTQPKEINSLRRHDDG